MMSYFRDRFHRNIIAAVLLGATLVLVDTAVNVVVIGSNKIDRVQYGNSTFDLRIPVCDIYFPAKTDYSERKGEYDFVQIPRQIFQTTKDVAHFSSLEACSLKSVHATMPGYDHYLFNDEASRSFVMEKYPEYLPYYDSFRYPVMRVDFWRYLIVYHYGGLYGDTDVVFYRAMNQWVSRAAWSKGPGTPIRMLVGVEGICDPPSKCRFYRAVQMVQWSFAAASRHPVLLRVLERIVERMDYQKANNITYSRDRFIDQVIETTGPAVFTDAISDYLEQRGTSLRHVMSGNVQVDDLYVMSTKALACENWASKNYDCSLPEAQSKHHFTNSWYS